ncbi:proline-rich protein 12-like [Varanus komodoensis]|uniref:proline-rich protein 12-like n=1 Tax=Varanus komodoensis TaxID=61221 RepID=UPI001CF7E6D2|nr:proline-rich protein 12-like [Varanus komodoensis]
MPTVWGCCLSPPPPPPPRRHGPTDPGLAAEWAGHPQSGLHPQAAPPGRAAEGQDAPSGHGSSVLGNMGRGGLSCCPTCRLPELEKAPGLCRFGHPPTRVMPAGAEAAARPGTRARKRGLRQAERQAGVACGQGGPSGGGGSARPAGWVRRIPGITAWQRLPMNVPVCVGGHRVASISASRRPEPCGSAQVSSSPAAPGAYGAGEGLLCSSSSTGSSGLSPMTDNIGRGNRGVGAVALAGGSWESRGPQFVSGHEWVRMRCETSAVCTGAGRGLSSSGHACPSHRTKAVGLLRAWLLRRARSPSQILAFSSSAVQSPENSPAPGGWLERVP